MIQRRPIFFVQLALCCRLMLMLANQARAAVIVDDFENNGGFDKSWLPVHTESGQGAVFFHSNREIARLSTDAVSVRTQLQNPLTIDLNAFPTLQVWVPNLEFGERLVISALLGSEGYATEHLLHDQYLEIPGQSPSPAAINLPARLGVSGQQQIKLRLRLIHEPMYGDPPHGAKASIDWIKLAQEPVSSQLVAPQHVSPANNALVEATTVTLSWSPPVGYGANTYSLLLSQDPTFSDESTISILDGINGASFVTPPLNHGRWYWAVSATAAGGFSGAWMFHEIAGDPRDPANRHPFSFVVSRDGALADDFRDRVGSIWFRNPGDTFEEQEQLALARETGSRVIKTFIRTNEPDKQLAMFQRPDHVEMFDRFDAICVNVLTDYIFTDWDSHGAYSTATREAVRRDWHAVTDYLLQRYQGTGKTFLLSHIFELNNFFGPTSPRPGFPVNDFIDDGQAGMRQAIAEHGHPTGVHVYDVVEVASARAGARDYVRDVIAGQDADLYSVSFYSNDVMDYPAAGGNEAFGPWETWAKTIREELEYVASHTTSTGPFGTRDVMVGEVGRTLDLASGVRIVWQGSRSGTWHLRLGAHASSTAAVQRAIQTVALTPNANYQISGWIAARMLDAGATLGLDVLNAGGERIATFSTPPVAGSTSNGGFGYAFVSTSLQAPALAAQGHFYIQLEGNGLAEVDDVSLRMNGATEMLRNGGFELITPRTQLTPQDWSWDWTAARIDQRNHTSRLSETALNWGAPYVFHFELVAGERDIEVAGDLGVIGPKPGAERTALWTHLHQAAHRPADDSIAWAFDGDSDAGWQIENGELVADGHALQFRAKGNARFASENFPLDPAQHAALQMDVTHAPAEWNVGLESPSGVFHLLQGMPAGPTGLLTFMLNSASPPLPAGQNAWRVCLKASSDFLETDWIKIVRGPAPAGGETVTLVGPPNDQMHVMPRPEMRWNLVAPQQPASWTLKLSRDADFHGSSLITYRDSLTETHWRMPAALQNGEWHWTVSPTWPGGYSGPFAPPGRFRVNAPAWREDFTSPTTFNTYSAPAATTIDGLAAFTTTGTLGRLTVKSGVAKSVGIIQTVGNFTIDVDQFPTMQVFVPYLEFGKRLIIQARDAAGGNFINLHDEWTAIPGQGARPQTLNLKGATGFSGLKSLVLQFQVADTIYGNVSAPALAAMDWIKSTRAPVNRQLAAPTIVSPSQGATVDNPVSLAWIAPPGFANNLYTVSYSRHPQLADGSTVTLRDQVLGNAITLPPLSTGTWYWTVSATDEDGFSGAFAERATTGDARDPLNHHYHQFDVRDATEARRWELYE